MSWLAADRSLHIAASALVAGAIAFELLVLRPAPEAARVPEFALRVRRWAQALAVLGVGVGLLSWAGWLAQVAIGMTGLPAAEALSSDNLRTVVVRTTFGNVWLLRTVLFLLVLPPLLLRRSLPARRFRWFDAWAVAAAAGLLGSLAWTGHAVASGRAHLWVDAAHLCAAALWLGMLPPLALLVHHACASRDAGALRLAGQAARRFSAPGLVAVLVLTLTGISNSWWLVGSVDRLFGTTYGLLLAGKLTLFALMIGLAAMNRNMLAPRIAEPDAAAARALQLLRRNVIAEIVLGAAVLAVVGTLGVTPPAAHEQPMHHHHEHDL